MGAGLKSARVDEQGIIAISDWSWYTPKMCLSDLNFWKIFSMLILSVSYCFFTKIAFKIFGSTVIADDLFLTKVGIEGYFAGALSRFAGPLLMQKIGFFKTYSLVLLVEIFIAFTLVKAV
jgi:hypothetical protein